MTDEPTIPRPGVVTPLMKKLVAAIAVTLLFCAALIEACMAHYDLPHPAWTFYAMMGAALAGLAALPFVRRPRALSIGMATGCAVVTIAFIVFMAAIPRT